MPSTPERHSCTRIISEELFADAACSLSALALTRRTISAGALDCHVPLTSRRYVLFMTRLPHFLQTAPVLRYLNWIAAALVTLCAVYLHALFFLNAGGLWRDEVDLVHLSLLPSVPEVWQNLLHDSCPILMHLAVRAWSATGLGNTDSGLRVLGLFVGLFLLLAFWFASWTMRNGAPLLAVTLASLNVTMVRAGDSLRGYGLGSALAVLTLAVIWRLTCRPSLAAFSCAVVVAVLSVQSLYQNAFLLFAACCGGF